jgi:hypothetical protein
MRGDFWAHHIGADRPQPLEGSFFIRPDQARIARDIGGEDRC